MLQGQQQMIKFSTFQKYIVYHHIHHFFCVFFIVINGSHIAAVAC